MHISCTSTTVFSMTLNLWISLEITRSLVRKGKWARTRTKAGVEGTVDTEERCCLVQVSTCPGRPSLLFFFFLFVCVLLHVLCVILITPRAHAQRGVK